MATARARPRLDNGSNDLSRDRSELERLAVVTPANFSDSEFGAKRLAAYLILAVFSCK